VQIPTMGPKQAHTHTHHNTCLKTHVYFPFVVIAPTKTRVRDDVLESSVRHLEHSRAMCRLCHWWWNIKEHAKTRKTSIKIALDNKHQIHTLESHFKMKSIKSMRKSFPQSKDGDECCSTLAWQKAFKVNYACVCWSSKGNCTLLLETQKIGRRRQGGIGSCV
jgi:hypothetical protein